MRDSRIALVGLLCLAPVMVAGAQAPWSMQVGGRSMLMVQRMPLAKLGTPFRDVDPGGTGIAHASSLFVLWRRSPRWNLGAETLVGTRSDRGGASMLFQSAGLLSEWHTGGTWFAAGGAQVGGGIVSATIATVTSDTGAVRSGQHVRSTALFAAPHVALGRVMGQMEFRVVARHTLHAGGETVVSAFNSTYLGVSIARRMGGK
jgi:hypothetical protein